MVVWKVPLLSCYPSFFRLASASGGSLMKEFGRYLLGKRMGLGGMAEVYHATLKGADGFSKDVVLKMMLENLTEDPELVQMFINEAKIAAMLSHPNIIRTFDFDKVEQTYFIAMEYIDGADLRKLIYKAKEKHLPFPQELALFILLKVLKALEYAHSFEKNGQLLHTIHRDISPHNVLISKRGEVKVIDFGIAKVLQQVSLTQTGTLKGKTSYMAPEQTLSSQVDHRADLFAAGILLWEMLCQQKLFSGQNEMQILEKIRHKRIPSPSELNDQVPQELSALVMKALERDEKRRFQSAREFSLRLQEFVGNVVVLEEKLRVFTNKLLAKAGGTQVLEQKKQLDEETKNDQAFAETFQLSAEKQQESVSEKKETQLYISSESMVAWEESGIDLTVEVNPSAYIPSPSEEKTAVHMHLDEQEFYKTDEVSPQEFLSQEQLYGSYEHHNLDESEDDFDRTIDTSQQKKTGAFVGVFVLLLLAGIAIYFMSK